MPKGGKVFAVPEKTVVITCTPTPQNGCPGANTSVGTTYYYLFKYDPTNPDENKRIPEMTGGELKSSGTQADFDQFGQPVVRLAFTSKGSHEFQRITRTLYQRGRLWKTPQQFAIVLDRDIKSFPQIDYTDPSLSNGISGGGQITNIGKFGEAKDLAIVLQTGALPLEFKQIERSDVSATLGKDSLKQAKTAALIGLLVVAIFLLIFYRFLGVIAVIGLGIYVAFLYGAILLLNVTLTLPGFAGLILTIGVAADANVVIFERIKEEVRSGKSIRAGDLERLPARLPHDPRRERRHVHHRVRAVRGRDRAGQGLRPDAAARHRALAGDGGRGDTRDARPARRLQAGSTTRGSWARRARRSRSGSRST